MNSLRIQRVHPVAQCLFDRLLIRILKIAAHGQAVGDAGDFLTPRACSSLVR